MKTNKILLIIISCFVYGFLYSQISEKPKVLIITTGGTIASTTDSTAIEGSELIRAVPQLLDYAEIEVEEFMNIGSSKMTPNMWLRLVKRVNAVIDEKPNLRCVVITHGTDTVEETAFFLNLTHKRKTPIILTGSMRSSDEVSADGPANLINAVRVGISEDAIGKGVMVVMNENISSGRDLLKAHNRRVDAFLASDKGYLGFVDPEKVTFHHSPIKRHTINSEFNVNVLDSLPKVDILYDFAGLDTAILSYFLKRPNQGLVISSFAGGRVSSGIEPIINLPEDHKPIVVSSSIKEGRIMGSNPEGTPIIVSNELPPNKARILLILALTKTNDIEKIQKYFDTY